MAASDCQRAAQKRYRKTTPQASTGFVRHWATSPGNVRVISYKANRLRNNGTFVELMQVVIDAARIHNAYGDL